ncbi:MAG: transcriptional regulator, partial [Myxococcota bacterium]
MYRRGNAFHGAHPFYMWYWGDKGRSQVGKVICVGATDQRVADILGWETAPTLTDAIERAKDLTKPNPDISMLHIPSILMTDVTP